MRRRRALIADPDRHFALQLSEALRLYSFDTEIVEDGPTILNRVREVRPDLIVLCVELASGTNGYAICAKLKRDVQSRDIPVVLVSSGAPDAAFEQHKKLKTRADGYMSKGEGFSIQEFLGLVGRFVPLEELT